MATPAQRKHLLDLMNFLVEQEPRVHYAQVRPMQTIHWREQQVVNLLYHGGSITMDCSEAVTCLCKWAGLKDPNGLNYNGRGFTGTLLGNLPHYTDPAKAKIGALVVFGRGSGHHVCMVAKAGADPVLWSHGQERGPIWIPLSDEQKYQPGPATFLSIAHL